MIEAALPWPAASALVEQARWLVIVVWIAANAALTLFALHRLRMIWWWWRLPRRAAPPAPRRRAWPRVTVQLPVWNEPCVIERLIDAAAALRYPAGLLEIQVLDDSTDATTRLARTAARRHRARGVDVRVLHRASRDGFKAGALAHGLRRSRGEILVVLDADFVPAEDFLERLVPHFDDPAVGMVQARWGHLNAGRSWRTAAQAAWLDFHFQVEHRVRAARGLFFNFNGTAGAWRRACIETSGGWRHDTLTEDLDLSVRAQLRGWRFRYDPTNVVPAELPSTWGALRSQQRRWVRGSVQTLRKRLPAVLRAPLPWSVKVDACFNLAGNLAYPLALLVALLAWPLAMLRPDTTVWAQGAVLAWWLLGLAPIAWALARLRRGETALARGRTVVGALAMTAALGAHNARAALAGFQGGLGAWERTPKTGEGLPRRRAARAGAGSRRAGWLDLTLGALILTSGVGVVRIGWIGAAPHLVLLGAGLAVAGVGTLREALRPRRAAADGYSRVILGERRPRRALRVSTTAFE